MLEKTLYEKNQEQFNNNTQTFFIPVSYTLFDRIPINAKSAEEALNIAKLIHETDNSLPILVEPVYAEDSYVIDEEFFQFDQ